MCDRLAPHQLDYDWRFTEQTAHELALTVKGERSLLLGCPTVAEALGAQGTGTTLIDRQPAATCRYTGRVVQADIRRDLAQFPMEPADIVVMDSPWYPDDLLLWMELALMASRVGTRILFSLWPSRTRPSAKAEIDEIFQRLATRGRLGREENALRYRTPGFEHFSVKGIGSEWRFGDLGTLTVSSPLPLGISRPRLRKSWSRFAFGDYQVAIRNRRGSAQDPRISPVFNSWHIPSVSRRHADLDKIEIWSSDNEVGRLTGAANFYRALRATVAGQANDLRPADQKALSVLIDNGFVPSRILGRRIEWTQFD